MRVYRGLRGALLVMTSRDPELPLGAELRNTAYQLQVYRALAIATNDAHGTLDVMLSASNPDVDRRALQQQYGFTEVQALAVMDMQFRRVTEIDNIALSAQSSATSPFVSSGAR